MSTIRDKRLQEQLLLQKLRKNVKNKRKLQNEDRPDDEKQHKRKEKEKIDKNSDNLTKTAIEEICRETKRAAERAETMGPSGWSTKKVTKTNKTFLNNTMRSVITHNQRTSEKCRTESKKKYDEITGRKPKFGTRTHLFQMSQERMTKCKKD